MSQRRSPIGGRTTGVPAADRSCIHCAHRPATCSHVMRRTIILAPRLVVRHQVRRRRELLGGDGAIRRVAPRRADGRGSPTDGRVTVRGELRWIRPDQQTVAIEERRTLTEVRSTTPRTPSTHDRAHPHGGSVLDRTPFTTWGGYGGLASAARRLDDTRLLLADGRDVQSCTASRRSGARASASSAQTGPKQPPASHCSTLRRTVATRRLGMEAPGLRPMETRAGRTSSTRRSCSTSP